MGCGASKLPALPQEKNRELRSHQKELEEANKKVKEANDKAAAAKNDAMEALREADETIGKAKKYASDVVRKAKQKAEEVREAAKKEKQDADEVVANAKKEAEAEVRAQLHKMIEILARYGLLGEFSHLCMHVWRGWRRRLCFRQGGLESALGNMLQCPVDTAHAHMAAHMLPHDASCLTRARARPAGNGIGNEGAEALAEALKIIEALKFRTTVSLTKLRGKSE